MKILDITSKLPYPLIDGARICMYQAVQALSSLGHEVHLVSFDEHMSDPGPLGALAAVHLIPLAPLPKHLGALATLFNRRPYTQLKRDLKKGYDYIDRLQMREQFDIIYADEIHIAAYGSWLKRRYGIPLVLRLHNIEEEIYRRHTDTVTNPLMRAYLETQTRRWGRFELEQIAQADACIAITRRDEATIEQLVPGMTATTIPAAVDLERFPFHGVEQRDRASVILLGDMAWLPNRDAAIWFAAEIMPLVRREIPELVVHLVGDNPPIRQLPAADEHFRIEGRVPAIAPFYERVTLGLIPLRVGGGMRVKMVEMMASGMPIISTTRGAEGNEATPGEHYLAADTAEEFAGNIVRLLRDEAERRRLSESARAFVSDFYSLEQTGRKLERLLLDTLSHRTTTPLAQ
jgi:glycosyltransferase involved in cell wall biosynthesis